MSEEIMKKYVDREGLNLFLGKLKDSYANNTSTKFVVKHALNAGKLSAARTFTFKNADGTETFGTTTWDGSGDFTVNLNVSASSPVGPVAGALIFKGVVTSQGFPQDYEGPTEGDVVVCTEDYTFESTSFKAGSEYLYAGNGWVELGSVITPVDLTNYYTKTEVDGLIDGLANTYATKAELADYETTAHAAETYATKTELGDYVTSASLATTLSHYYDKEAADQKFLSSEQAASVYETKVHAEATYVAKKDHVTEPEISKMFPVDFVVEEGATPSEVTTAFGNYVTALGDGGALNVDTDVITPTTGVYGMVIGSSDGNTPVDVTFNLSEDASLTATNSARVFSVNPNSKVEIIGATNPEDPKPTVTGTADEPSIFIANNSSVTLEGIELSGENYSALQSNGLNENSDFYLKNCVINGPCYMPACGNLVIENCEFHASTNVDADAGALYVKSGSITIRNSKFYGATAEHAGVSGPWKHNNNGWNGIATALVLENCNYGGHGNLKIDIDAASQFFAGYCDTTAEAGKQYDNVGILVINYKGNHCAEGDCNIAQNFYEIDVTESTIGKHYFTLDGRGGTEQLTLVEYQG